MIYDGVGSAHSRLMRLPGSGRNSREQRASTVVGVVLQKLPPLATRFY